MKKQFFDIVRKELFSNTLNQLQVEGLEFILDYYESQSEIKDIKQLAYILGTIHHETGATMQPIEEWGKGKGKPYAKRIDVDRSPYSDTLNIFFGRGYTQNTWRTIYIKLTKANTRAWDFFNNPELLLEKEPSIWATFYAMKTGLYTGRKLSDYDLFNDSVLELDRNSPIFGLPKWYNVRKTVNALDKAEKIANISRIYLKALTA